MGTSFKANTSTVKPSKIDEKMIQTIHKCNHVGVSYLFIEDTTKCVEYKYKNSTTNMSISRLKKKKKNKSMN